MAKYKWDEAEYRKRVEENRGQGTGSNYKPWIEVGDLSSKGRSSRMSGWKTERLHHLLSDLERKYCNFLEWSDLVTDIREQFPLTDLELAMDISKKLGFIYPTDRKSGTPYVLTTDFMVIVNSCGKELKLARTVKYAKDLEKERTRQLFEIERRYWEQKGVDWAIVTERIIPMQLVANVDWIHEHYWLTPTPEHDTEELTEIAELLKERLLGATSSIQSIAAKLDKDLGLNKTSLKLFRYLLARKQIVMDMNQEIHPKLPASCILEIQFTDAHGEGDNVGIAVGK